MRENRFFAADFDERNEKKKEKKTKKQKTKKQSREEEKEKKNAFIFYHTHLKEPSS